MCASILEKPEKRHSCDNKIKLKIQDFLQRIFTGITLKVLGRWSPALARGMPPRSCCEAGRAGNKAPTVFRGTQRPSPPRRPRANAGGICPALPPTQREILPR